MKIKTSTIIRLIALILTIANQIFAVVANGSIDFASSNVYQIISIILTVLVGIACFWYNNDFTKTARLVGVLFDALKDGKISSAEVENLLGILQEKDETSTEEIKDGVETKGETLTDIQSSDIIKKKVE